MSRVVLVLLPNTTYYMLDRVRTRLATEVTPPLVITTGSVPGWVVENAPHAHVSSLSDESSQLVLDMKPSPSLIVTDLIVFSDRLYDKIMQAADAVKAEVWCIMHDACITRNVLLSADEAWLPKGSRWCKEAPKSLRTYSYDADALYLKNDIALGSSNEREVGAFYSGYIHEEARQLPIRLVSNGSSVTLIA